MRCLSLTCRTLLVFLAADGSVAAEAACSCVPQGRPRVNHVNVCSMQGIDFLTVEGGAVGY